jgi:hypothetical protein
MKLPRVHVISDITYACGNRTPPGPAPLVFIVPRSVQDLMPSSAFRTVFLNIFFRSPTGDSSFVWFVCRVST